MYKLGFPHLNGQGHVLCCISKSDQARTGRGCPVSARMAVGYHRKTAPPASSQGESGVAVRALYCGGSFVFVWVLFGVVLAYPLNILNVSEGRTMACRSGSPFPLFVVESGSSLSS